LVADPKTAPVPEDLSAAAERKRLEQQLAKAQRQALLGQLAGCLVHDFNNLLGVIMGYSSILQKRVPQDDMMHDMLAEITDSAQVAAGLTRRLLVFSRREVQPKQPLELNEIVEAMCGLLRRLLPDDVRLEAQLAAECPVIEADTSQIEQLLVNLIVNARDAMPRGGTVTVQTALVDGEPGSVQLSVSDTGVGMDEVTQAGIFTTPTGSEALGLGLSVVSSIVTQSGGTLAVHSAPGEGARFDVTLPLCECDRSAPPRLSLVRTGRNETVLLAEDRVAFRAAVAEILADRGYRALVAHDPFDALRIAEQHPEEIHVLLTDVAMPGMDGPELAQRVVALRPLKVLFMSGYACDPDIVGGALADRAAFLAKPFMPEELDEQLRQLIDGAE